MSAKANEPEQPFIGARPFENNDLDRGRFYGRYFETKRIVSYVFSQSVTLLYAPSGSGKTSLIHAAVIPELEEKDCNVLPVTRVQISTASNEYFDKVKNKYVFNAILRMLPAEVDPEDVVDETISSFVEKYPNNITYKGNPIPRLLVFDQFEEIFTMPTVSWLTQREDFFVQIADALNAHELLRVLFVIREEYVGQVEKYERFLPGGFGARFRLGALSIDNAERALKIPLQNTNRKFDKGVVKQIVSDMAMIKWLSPNKDIIEIDGDSIEPVHLQLVGATLWDNLPSNVTTIKKSDVEQYGNVDKILLDYYEKTILKLVKTHNVKEKQLRSWIEANLITPAGTRGIVFQEKEITQGLKNVIIDKLTDSHIIRREERSGGFWYELAHDRWVGPINDANSRWRQVQAKKIQKRSLLGVLLLFVSSIVAGWYAFSTLNMGVSIVPSPKGIKDLIVKKFEKPHYGNFNVNRDMRYIDLRSRKKLEFWQNKTAGNYSPVTWVRTTWLGKKEAFINTQRIVFKFATTGNEVVPRSLTHKYELETSKTDRTLHPEKKLNMTRYIYVDVSNEKTTDEFLVTTEATFWNAFQGSTEWASITPVDKDTSVIGVSLLFPQDNLHTEITLRKYNINSKEKVAIFKLDTSESPLKYKSGDGPKQGRDGETYELFLDKLNRTVYWLVKNPDINYRYDVGWNWDQGKILDDIELKKSNNDLDDIDKMMIELDD